MLTGCRAVGTTLCEGVAIALPDRWASPSAGIVGCADGRPRTRGKRRREIANRDRSGDVFVPDGLVPKLRRFWVYKMTRRERLDPDAPLFCFQTRRRISKGRVQVVFRDWQVRAGFDASTPSTRSGTRP